MKNISVSIPILYDVDVCVCGGGPSGTAAAINSAKNGAKTVLIERGIALGGLATLGCVYPFMQTHAPNSDTPYVAEIKKRLIEKKIFLQIMLNGIKFLKIFAVMSVKDKKKFCRDYQQFFGRIFFVQKKF